MDDREAANTLLELLKKTVLTDAEREAVHKAVGVLSWTSLAEKRLGTMRERREKRMKKMD